MRRISFVVPPEYEGTMVKVFLRNRHGVSAGILAAAKRISGGILVNGEAAYAIRIVHAGDTVTFLAEQKPSSALPVLLPFNAVYEDEDFFVVEKPPAMPMYPTPGHDADSLMNATAWHFRKKGLPSVFYPLYRLDRDTTGLVLLAKNSYAASAAIQTVQKEYVAFCRGNLRGKGREEGKIGLMPGHKVQRCVCEEGDPAVTNWEVLESGNNLSFLRFLLETGRTHQIRVHMAHRGNPLEGDDLYGGSLHYIHRQALHVSQMAFFHPVKEQQMRFVSPIPPDMQRVYSLLKGSK